MAKLMYLILIKKNTGNSTPLIPTHLHYSKRYIKSHKLFKDMMQI